VLKPALNPPVVTLAIEAVLVETVLGEAREVEPSLCTARNSTTRLPMKTGRLLARNSWHQGSPAAEGGACVDPNVYAVLGRGLWEITHATNTPLSSLLCRNRTCRIRWRHSQLCHVQGGQSRPCKKREGSQSMSGRSMHLAHVLLTWLSGCQCVRPGKPASASDVAGDCCHARCSTARQLQAAASSHGSCPLSQHSGCEFICWPLTVLTC
jgi:hypothetical protein